jgi:hypothetical protein
MERRNEKARPEDKSEEGDPVMSDSVKSGVPA